MLKKADLPSCLSRAGKETMTVGDALKALRDRGWIPFSAEHFGTVKGTFVLPSNGELKRWCLSGAVRIDGQKVGFHDPVPAGARCLQFFAGSGSQCTMPFPQG